MKKIQNIAILTSGGDAPGMNIVIRYLIKHLIKIKKTPYLIYEGYQGLYNNQIFKFQDLKINLDFYSENGGTFIKSSRFPDFKKFEIRKKCFKNLIHHQIDLIIAIGGNGTYQGLKKIKEFGMKVIGIPATIDNDVNLTNYTIGFDTALNTIDDAIKKIKSTSFSHQKCSLIEIMGRDNPDLTILSGINSFPNLIITKFNKLTKFEIVNFVKNEFIKNKHEAIIILVMEKLYANLHEIAKFIEEETNIITRANILGYIQRGGQPSAKDKSMAGLMAIKACHEIEKNNYNILISYCNGEIKPIEIEKFNNHEDKIFNDVKKEKVQLINEINKG